MDMITIVNIVILAILLFFIWSGYRQGFVLKLISIFSFFVTGFVSWYLSGIIANWISLYPHDEGSIIDTLLYDNLNHITLFVVLFLLLQVVLMALRPSLRILNHIPVVSLINRIAGCVLGLLQGLLILFLVTMVLRLPLWETGNDIASTSLLRHSDALAELALFYTKEPIDELNKISDVVQDKKAFTQEEADRLYAWLLNQNINKENADEIMNMLRVE